jgi:hypothetical protein
VVQSSAMLLETTTAWLARAVIDPAARHPKHLPESLDLREHAATFLHTFHAAPTGTEIGFPLVLKDGRLHFPLELASLSHYPAFIDGGRLVGTFHVHPADRAPFFDPQDLANALRSDNPGFLDLLLARDRLHALVRANPYVYISAHHVNRNPLLLQEPHAERLARAGGADAAAPEYAERYRKASLYWFGRYQLALYEGDPQGPLRRTYTPEGTW